MASNKQISQALEDQSIFDLVGDTEGTHEEREKFLDELQKVVWDDFLDNDVELLLTEEELHPLEEIVTRADTDQLTKQQEIVSYLQTKIPDLEEIMMEKALKLKDDLLHERIAGMERFYADKPAALAKINAAKVAIADGLYYDAILRLYEADNLSELAAA
jgi:oligoribonuclease NrnB/cAMP/cGMP phosphodiesterase (DHH superfamily)